MIVEINDTLVNIDNICTAKRCFQDTDNPGRLKPCIYITFLNGKTESIEFKNDHDMQVGYQTLRLFETTISKNRNK